MEREKEKDIEFGKNLVSIARDRGTTKLRTAATTNDEHCHPRYHPRQWVEVVFVGEDSLCGKGVPLHSSIVNELGVEPSRAHQPTINGRNSTVLTHLKQPLASPPNRAT